MNSDALIGQRLGAYLIQRKLGEGAMARVYKAYHSRLRRDVAIKIIRPEVAARPGFAARFEQEAQLIASLEHPHIVAVYDFGEAYLGELGTIPYLVMQYVGGGTLRDLLREGRPLDHALAIRYARDMASALHLAHERGIVHRDVKPQNMLLTRGPQREILLSDFGIAKLLDRRAASPSSDRQPLSAGSEDEGEPTQPELERLQLTGTSELLGTAAYMAPEQIRRLPVDARTDIYALGVVLFQMLTGHPPFEAQSTAALLYHHVYSTAPDVRTLNPAIPAPLAQIIARALAKAPEERFQSATELAHALDELLLYESEALHMPATVSDLDQAGASSLPTDAPAQSPALAAPAQITPATRQVERRPAVTSALTSGLIVPEAGSKRLDEARPQQTPFTFSGRLLARRQLSLALGLLILLLLIIGTLAQGQISSWLQPWTMTGPTSEGLARPFTDTFQTNEQRWTESAPAFNTAIGNGQYVITIGQTPPATYYFPYPQAAGNLPTNFTLSAQIQRLAGNEENWYGLAFRLHLEGNYVSCYALVIDGAGHYALWKFDAHAGQPGTPLILVSGLYSPRKHAPDLLELTARGDTFTARINGVPVDFNTSTRSVSDPGGYSGGRPGLLVTGPQARFLITRFTLALP
ncbi:serine/threonine-protein kinase [Thermogemmatispora sp.]|uniref:serine/threonine-protein kinase n=1 Tax=Thermogemmatispora sp. TaxID=1968838 RepID=UPI001D1DA043|nr:serine/threonine-protein kinase [Thermogemmatispora sp.]MBX5449349.1 serine/threonine protein kinase [Thermogemmatispora sp.]